MENWKWITGYEGTYQISDHGRLKSFKSDPCGRVLSNKNKDGWYLTVNLVKNGVRKTTRIHVLVAKAFIGDIPKGYHVHHKDGNKQNNHVDNLEIIHPSKHREETLKVLPQIEDGMRNYNRYIRPKPILMYDLDGNYLASFPNSIIAERITGVCQRNILQVASKEEYRPNRTRKQAGGYIWKYEEREGVVK